ncbi:uncharacterized protein TDEL_0B01900 [Torulaspora delbrueckii]|uniref:Major facilitator superfamily (MFS) profile domain-containing protein n=1 Tax=Torulaspora delbrueckii TaxID=4950 RepID=G8ZNX5_TORDE|nr:hypothetical protein TDEL_0B01900 [Torulaspora delbrueckii]CCE90319.1 hypothetical protein TDEL_0B01900 [Torulaspora delbrueckii]
MDTDQNAGRGTPVKSGNLVSDKGTTTLLRQDQFDNERADMGLGVLSNRQGTPDMDGLRVGKMRANSSVSPRTSMGNLVDQSGPIRPENLAHLTVKDSVLTGRPLLYFTSIFVSLGVFLFGYDQGVMSGCLTGHYFKNHFNNPSRAAIGNMVSILEIGALVSSLLVGRLGEKWGRRRTIKYGSLIFVIGGLFQGFADKMMHLIIGRTISGLGVGLLSTIVPIYQSEISPPHNRGKLACIEFTGNIVGYAASVWIDYGCSFIEGNASWRIPLLLQSVIGFALFCGTFVILETPRWLLNHDHDVEGLIVIADLHSDGDVQDQRAKDEYHAIKETVLISRMEGEGKSHWNVFKRYKRRMLIAMSSQMFAQLNGINVISYYAPMVFEQAGWVGREAILMTGINGLIYVLSTLPPWTLVDKWGRKPILMTGGIFMGCALVSISISMLANIPATPKLVVLFVIVFNAFFGFSWGPIPWLYPVEIAPLSARSAMASSSTATNWLCNWLVGIMTPILQEKIAWRLYLIHATSCFISFAVVFKLYPETAGLRLEDMDSVFDDRSSTFSFARSELNSGDYATDIDAMSTKSAGPIPDRQPGVAQPTVPGGPMMRSNQSIKSRTTGLTSFPMGTLEPPSVEQVLDFKAKQQQKGIKTAIRRGSENISLFVSKVIHLGDREGTGNGAYGTISANDLESGN